MFKLLFPNDYIESIFRLDIMQLKKDGMKGIIFDIDNTLVPYDVAEPTKEIIDFFEQIKAHGMKIALLSNNTEDRVIKFNEKLKVIAIHKSRKPSTKSFKEAIKKMQCSKDEVVIVGDQVFTDVFGGNRFGIKTILVVPVSDKDEWITKIKRGIEKKVIRQYEKHTKKYHNR
jgi:HAD superfamily phosphatase (TIGR01668 family)